MPKLLAYFFMHYKLASTVPTEVDLAKKYPNVQAWLERMKERPAVKETMEEYARKWAEVVAAGAAAAAAAEKK